MSDSNERVFSRDISMGLPLRFISCDTPATAWLLGHLHAQSRATTEAQKFTVSRAFFPHLIKWITVFYDEFDVSFYVAGITTYERLICEAGVSSMRTLMRIEGTSPSIKPLSSLADPLNLGHARIFLEINTKTPGKMVCDRMTIVPEEASFWPTGSLLFKDYFMKAVAGLFSYYRDKRLHTSTKIEMNDFIGVIKRTLSCDASFASRLLDQLIILGMVSSQEGSGVLSLYGKVFVSDLLKNLGISKLPNEFSIHTELD